MNGECRIIYLFCVDVLLLLYYWMSIQRACALLLLEVDEYFMPTMPT